MQIPKRVPSRAERSTMTLDECEQHFDSVRAAGSLDEACLGLVPLFGAYDIMNIGLRKSTPFWRARVAKPIPWDQVAEMGPPPAEHVGMGRVNAPGSPVFYTANLRDTAIIESRAKANDHVQVAAYAFRPGAEVRVAVVGDWFHVYKTGGTRIGADPDRTLARYLNQMDEAVARRVLYVDAFLADIISDKTASERGYVLSRAVAVILQRASPKTEGIVYPSVLDPLGNNIALQVHAIRKLRLVGCQHLHVEFTRHYGLLDYAVNVEAKNVEDGSFRWGPPEQGRRTYFNLTHEESLDPHRPPIFG